MAGEGMDSLSDDMDSHGAGHWGWLLHPYCMKHSSVTCLNQVITGRVNVEVLELCPI